MTLARLRTVLRHLRDGPGSDADLARRYAATRDPDAFAELVRRHGRLVWGVCRRATRSNADADDAYQATWLVFAKNPAAVRTPAAVGGWLHGVAVRVARRVAARRPTADPTHLPDRTANVGEAAGVREYLAALDEELARLPDRLRLPLVLCFLEEQTQDEAAKRLGLSLSTLKRRLDAGKGLLRSRLAGRGVDLSAALAGAGLAAVGPPTLAGTAGGVAVQVSREVLFAMWTTKLQAWAAGVLVAGGLAAGGGAYVATTYAQGPGKGDGSPVAKSDGKPGGQPTVADRIREAREAELATLRKQYDLDMEVRKAGTISGAEAAAYVLNMLSTSSSIYRAEAALARTSGERIAAARGHLDRIRDAEKYFATLASRGLIREQFQLQAAAFRHAAEAELLRVEAGQADAAVPKLIARPQPTFSQQFDRASWDAVLNWFTQISSLVQITTSKPTGTLTLTIRDRTMPQVVDLLNEALAAEKFVLIRQTQSFHIRPADEKIPAELIPFVTTDALVTGKYGETEIVSVLVDVKTGSDALTAVRNLLSPFGAITPAAEGRSLVTDRVAVIRKVLAFLQPARALQPPADPADVRDLRQKQLETARQALALIDARMKAGTAPGGDQGPLAVLGWEKRVYELERDLARTPAERLAAANAYLQRVREAEQVVAALLRAGRANPAVGLEATFLRQEAEVFVKQAEQAANRPERKPVSAPAGFRGAVRRVSVEGGQVLVELTPGADAGLQRGAMLAVRRVSGVVGPVGMVRVLSVNPKDAVGVFILPSGSLPAPDDVSVHPKAGDALTAPTGR